MKPVQLIASGMISGVGHSAPACCAAIHCAVDNFQETRFLGRNGDWIVASEVTLEPPVRGREKMLMMATSAVAECKVAILDGESVLLIAAPEESRPGGQFLEDTFVDEVSELAGLRNSRFSKVIRNGGVGGIQAVDHAIELIHEHGCRNVVVCGVDTLLTERTLSTLDRDKRLLTKDNSNGLIPGEGAGAIVLSAPDETRDKQFLLYGCGYGVEAVTINHSDQPFRANGLVSAIQEVFHRTGLNHESVDYRLTDISGELYAFKEAALAASRTIKTVKEEFDLLHPADCIGDVGAAVVPIMVAVAANAAQRQLVGGRGVLFHCSNNDSQRAAMMGGFEEQEI